MPRPPPTRRAKRSTFDRLQVGICAAALAALLVLFATPLPREVSALLIAACLIVSRVLPSRQLFGEIDLPLLILFAALFVVNDAFARTGLPEEAVRQLAAHGLLPDRVALLEPIALFLSNTIGNVPAVVMILKVWQGIPAGNAGRARYPVDAGRQSVPGRQPCQSDRCRTRQAARRAADLSPTTPRPACRSLSCRCCLPDCGCGSAATCRLGWCGRLARAGRYCSSPFRRALSLVALIQVVAGQVFRPHPGVIIELCH